MAVSPIYNLFYQIQLQYHLLIGYFQDRFEKHRMTIDMPKCIADPTCRAIETLGKLLFQVNLTIPILFYFNFDLKFKNVLKNITKAKNNNKNNA